MLKYWRDAYAYCWPRDAALVLWPLIRLGYKDEPYRFFDFCRRIMTPGGYVMHKYSADSALGSSWHPYLHENGVVAPPIQEDETALILFMFSQFYHIHTDMAVLKEFYTPMVEPMANFMSSYLDHHTNLPRASYDLWEESFATSSFTTSVVYAALQAAADLADVMKDHDNAVKWRSAAESIQESAQKYLVHSDGVIAKSVSIAKDGTVTTNPTIDASSFYGGFMFGLFDIASKEVSATAARVTEVLRTDGVGISRYENDSYRRVDGASSNPWFITTLWMAQYNLEVGNRDDAIAALDWVHSNAWHTGVLSEQLYSTTNKEASVSPLCWSQAEYVSTLLDTITENNT
jgi:GH15 family glucan-1,4-alpha-glucosidase